MNLENNIKEIINRDIKNGIIEEAVSKKFKEAIDKALDSLFSSYGDITKLLEEEIKKVMVDYLESYDYSKYIVKLDSVLKDILDEATLPNRELLENFKELMKPIKLTREDSIKVSEIAEVYADYCSTSVDTSKLEVVTDDSCEPYYEHLTINVEFQDLGLSAGRYFEEAVLHLQCEDDEALNANIKLYRSKSSLYRGGDRWSVSYRKIQDLKSLRHLDKFEIFVMKLAHNFKVIEVDEECFDLYEIEVEAEPEPEWS